MTLDFATARENMVETQVRVNDVTDHGVQDAMGTVKRERLCPPDKLHLAYAESPVEYAPGYSMMQPRDTAKLLQGLRPRHGERALAIAAPYAAAVLNWIGVNVALRLPTGVEASALTEALSADGVPTVFGDLAALDENGPYDLIVVEGAVSETPKAWIDMLHLGGRLGVVERSGPIGRARLYTRSIEGVVSDRVLFDATPPMLPGFTPAPAFSF